MPSTLHSLTTEVLDRLGDQDNKIWSRSEIEGYIQDGYDEFCRRSKVLFDIWVVENQPATGNWQTDFERYLAEQKPGFTLTDEPFHFTGEHERNLGVGGAYGGSYSGPASSTSVSERSLYSGETSLVDTVYTGSIPTNTVEVLRVAYDNRSLTGMGSAQMNELYPNHQTVTGDPQWFVYDRDGLFRLRFVPAPAGDASYDTVSGTWGTMTYTDDTDVTANTADRTSGDTGGFGILRWRDDMFPALGQWGTPTRVHPEDSNIKVEMYRLGRDLASYTSELPIAYEKYVIYYAMGEAMEREGDGQQLELAEHYFSRFEMGLKRIEKKKRDMQYERAARLGGPASEPAFGGLGDPQPPYPYGKPF